MSSKGAHHTRITRGTHGLRLEAVAVPYNRGRCFSGIWLDCVTTTLHRRPRAHSKAQPAPPPVAWVERSDTREIPGRHQTTRQRGTNGAPTQGAATIKHTRRRARRPRRRMNRVGAGWAAFRWPASFFGDLPDRCRPRLVELVAKASPTVSAHDASAARSCRSPAPGRSVSTIQHHRGASAIHRRLRLPQKTQPVAWVERSDTRGIPGRHQSTKWSITAPLVSACGGRLPARPAGAGRLLPERLGAQVCRVFSSV